MAAEIAQAYAEELQDLVNELETPEGEIHAPDQGHHRGRRRGLRRGGLPQPLRNLALAGVLGLLLGIGLAVARELLDTSLTTSDDIGDVTDAPILGNIATDEAANLAPLEVLSSATPWAEAFRVLRTNMQYVEVDEEQKVIVMTSSLPGEGKSTTAINLALTTAMAGQRVVLVEADLRRPLIAQRLQLDGAVGTTNVLIGKVSLADALQEYGTSGLQVLACGPIPPNPSELLQSHAMEALLADLRGKFDVIIVDAPPLLPVTDAALLAAQADGAVIVVRHGRTTRDQLQHSIERLEAVDAKALGVVINQAPSRKNRTGYGYGYGYGYGFESEAEVGQQALAPRGDRARQGGDQGGIDEVRQVRPSPGLNYSGPVSFFQIEGYVYLVVMLALLAVKSYAFISSLLFPAEAYTATGKLTKPAWSIILGLGLLAQVLLISASPINLIHLAFTIAALVYLADVRPALAEVTSGR